MYAGLKNLEVPRRRHPRARRFFKVSAISVSVLAVLFGATAYVVYRKVDANLNQGRDATIKVEAALPNGPLNVLVLGSDRRDVIEGQDRNARQFKGGGGQRADTIILMHLAADKKTAVLLSFPRDLRVDIPGHGKNKINSAYTFGGANLVIQTIKNFTGLDIHHYVEVNFASFRTIVDAVGGVSVFINRPLVDKKSGLNLPRAGCWDLDGDMALSFVRARNVDPTADLGRIQRQQLFMRVLMRKVKSVSFILNFTKVIRLSEAVGKGLRYDQGVDLDLARAVASRLAGFDSKRVDFRIVPGFGRYIGDVSYIVPKETSAKALFTAIGNDTELPGFGKTSQSVPEPEDVTVSILNGTGTAGVASKHAARLRTVGFEVAGTGNFRLTSKTIIRFNPDAELRAQLVAKYYPGALVRAAIEPQASDVVLTLGKDVLVSASGSSTARGKPKPNPKDAEETEKPLLDVSCKKA